jgi:hypothetical protein
MPEPKFDPRQAALDYAAKAENTEQLSTAEQYAMAVEANTCALIYIGDQLERLADLVEKPLGVVVLKP